MTDIDINPGSGDPVTININCACEPTTPPAPAAAMTELDLYGYAAATVLPHYCNTAVAELGPYLLGATAILPAGRSLASVGIGVAVPASGVAAGECAFGVYMGGIPELVATTAPKANLFASAGVRWAPLKSAIEASDQDRVVWLVAQVPAYSIGSPAFLSALHANGPSMINAQRYRSVIVEGQAELPPMFDADAVPFTSPRYLPMLVGSSDGVIQP
ncbi:hypothetical protein ACIHFD_49215 [Nonomuraea sp. NPDC051941]|uniref:hypothetical protein n=1 Tax=Nonomuraea sp. NPDC051941 TaxID=3364373 RepID=UPI0037C63DCB